MAEGLGWKVFLRVNSALTALSYPIGAIWLTQNRWPATVESARAFWQLCLSIWLPVTAVFNYYMWVYCTWRLPFRIVAHIVWFGAWDLGMVWFAVLGHLVGLVLTRKECTNRLFNREAGTEKFLGPKIVVLGNGPSLAMSDPYGAAIDSMDEVVRFNNFQTKTSGLENWTGHKTTVHISDSMLYPSYEEYKVPGACVALSLFMDRLMIAGGHFLFRICVDIAFKEAFDLMFDPALGWILAEDIHNMKKTLGIQYWKHPTSGVMAIDWMVRHRPDPSVPVYIHGFDFFQGPTVHYYSKTEPIYERINDLIGVNMMHEPQREKAFVEKLVKEGKVKWVKDYVEDGDGGKEVTAAVAAAKEKAAKDKAAKASKAS